LVVYNNTRITTTTTTTRNTIIKENKKKESAQTIDALKSLSNIEMMLQDSSHRLRL
jgi:hypothetical protein